MDWVVVILICLFFLPFPVAFLYALIKHANRFLIITPLIISVVYVANFCCFAMAVPVKGLHYVGGNFIIAVIGTIGLYYGFIRHQAYIGESEVGMNILRWFLVCLTVIVFPLLPALFWCWAVHSLPRPAEAVRKKRPEVGERPSWRDVAKEREKKEGGG